MHFHNPLLAKYGGYEEADLALLVDVVLKVVLLAQDWFGDEVLVVDADCGHERGMLGVREPRDLSGLLKICVL